MQLLARVCLKMRKATGPNGVENDATPPNLISASCDLDLWPPDPWSWPSHDLAPWTTCASLKQNRFINFQNIAFTSNRQTDGRTMDGWTGWKYYAFRRQRLVVERCKAIHSKCELTIEFLFVMDSIKCRSTFRFTLGIDSWAIGMQADEPISTFIALQLIGGIESSECRSTMSSSFSLFPPLYNHTFTLTITSWPTQLSAVKYKEKPLHSHKKYCHT